jgi:hypothetical protein
MAELTTIRLPQTQEQHTIHISRSGLAYRYAYGRSADSRLADDTGQDYLVIQEDAESLAFALCDGVSQSFMGHLAAQLLGDALVAWFWDKCAVAETIDVPVHELTIFLNELPKIVAHHIQELELPADLPPMVRDVLERKRALGSESTFIAGLINTKTNRLLLAWMGDSRVRLWGAHQERTSELGATFHTSERWSTQRGLVGQLHTMSISLEDVHRIVVYSDGMAVLDGMLEHALSNQALDTIIAETADTPTSDDISFLEIDLAPVSPTAEFLTLPAPTQLSITIRAQMYVARWQAIAGATCYEIEVRNDQARRWIVQNPSWQHTCDTHTTCGMLSVRAWSDEMPGRWSAPVALPQPAALNSARAISALPEPAGSQPFLLYLIVVLALVLFGAGLGWATLTHDTDQVTVSATPDDSSIVIFVPRHEQMFMPSNTQIFSPTMDLTHTDTLTRPQILVSPSSPVSSTKQLNQWPVP